MGWAVINASSAGPISRSATQSGLRTLASGSRDPSARAAAVRIEVREGNPSGCIPALHHQAEPMYDVASRRASHEQHETRDHGHGPDGRFDLSGDVGAADGA